MVKKKTILTVVIVIVLLATAGMSFYFVRESVLRRNAINSLDERRSELKVSYDDLQNAYTEADDLISALRDDVVRDMDLLRQLIDEWEVARGIQLDTEDIPKKTSEIRALADAVREKKEMIIATRERLAQLTIDVSKDATEKQRDLLNGEITAATKIYSGTKGKVKDDKLRKTLDAEIKAAKSLAEEASPDRVDLAKKLDDLTAARKKVSESNKKWLKEEAAKVAAAKRYYKYCVVKRGNPNADLREFAATAVATYADSRGWEGAGAVFTTSDGACDFNLVLSEAKYMSSYSSVCTADWSCQVGNNVIINVDRWNNATPSWNAGGGSLLDYRYMVINHETGHFLGHYDNEMVCAGAGKLAPIMQQQSMDLRGCKFNPWPLKAELWLR